MTFNGTFKIFHSLTKKNFSSTVRSY